MEKMKYERARMDIYEFDVEDVLTTSGELTNDKWEDFAPSGGDDPDE